MSSRQAIPLSVVVITPGDCDYQSILSWPFAEEPFYERQIKWVLETDIPQRARYGECAVFVHKDPAGTTVGFSTLERCKEYERITGGKSHMYIPVLAVHPSYRGQGHGRTIIEQIFAFAVLGYHLWKGGDAFSDLVFLDVYSANEKAIALYKNHDFEILNPDAPIPDPEENNEPYFVMAKRA